MEPEVEFLRRGQNMASGCPQDEHHAQSQEVNPAESPSLWVSDRSVMAPLLDEYERHTDEMGTQLHDNQVLMADLKGKLERVVMENESTD